MKGPYRGRFAPTPSGPLHLGSLVTALAGYLQARALNGSWLLRIDDLDRPRIAPGAEDAILRQLEAHAMTWDEPPRRQSDHVPQYEAALRRLEGEGAVYACTCTRAVLRRDATVGDDEPVYPGRCREAGFDRASGALRVRVGTGRAAFVDGFLGTIERDLEHQVGDFVLRRRDGQIAYQLASAVDEAAQGITEVVRGADLVSSTVRQVHLMHRLGLTVPAYRHLPVLVDARGRKLSKQNHAPPIEESRAAHNLRLALAILGQPEPAGADPRGVIEEAVRRWTPGKVPLAAEIPA